MAPDLQTVERIVEKINAPVFPDGLRRDVGGGRRAGKFDDFAEILQDIFVQGPDDVLYPCQSAVDRFRIDGGKTVGVDLECGFLRAELGFALPPKQDI